MCHFTDAERIQIIIERNIDGKTLETIARPHECTPAAISKIVSRYKLTKQINGGKPTGRPKSLNKRQMEKLDQLISNKPTATGIELVNDVLQSTGKHVSVRSIQRYRRALGYRPYHQSVKKSLTLAQQQSKLLFAQQHMNDDITK